MGRPGLSTITLALVVLSADASSSSAGSISLGGAANYVVLQYNAAAPGPTAGTSQAVFSVSGGATIVNGPLGSAANTRVNFSGNPPSGPLDQSSVNTGGDNFNGLTPIHGSAVDNALNAAVQDAINASTTAAALTPNQTFTSTLTGGETINATVAGQNVIDLKGGINMTGSTGITLNGTANDVFVLDVESQLVSNNGTSITLTGGLTASHVLWNYLGTSTASFTGGGHTQTWEGTVLAPNASISAHDRTFDGALISGKDITITSNAWLNYAPGRPASVPEPSTMALAVTGLLALGIVGLYPRGRRGSG